jgi:hypothetical protein
MFGRSRHDCHDQRKRDVRGRAVRITTGIKLRGPERSEGHVSFNIRVMRHRHASPNGQLTPRAPGDEWRALRPQGDPHNGLSC